MTTALCLLLAGCGSDGGESSVGSAGAASGSGTTPSVPSASPTGGSSASPAARECPLRPTPVRPPARAVKDLRKKPSVAGSTAPPPEVVQVADIVVGKGAQATTLSTVEVRYVGALYTSGKDFDSSWKRSPTSTFPFTVCATGTVPGFAIGPLGMKVGGRRQVTIPSDLGYGATGSPPTIPPNAALVFVIDLVKVTPPAS